MVTKQLTVWHCAAILVAANLIGAIPAGLGGDEVFYNSFRQPSIAPPGWLFAPMWLVLNVTSLIALYRIANLPVSQSRTFFLISEAIGWVLFAVFSTLYFLLRSPVLGAIDTVAGLFAALLSVLTAWRIERPASALVSLRLIWLILASYVGVYMAIVNVDPFLS
jgi:tryptophan-rich sensory protein